MKCSELMELRSLCGQRLAEVWEKDELEYIQAARPENGMPTIEMMELWNFNM